MINSNIFNSLLLWIFNIEPPAVAGRVLWIRVRPSVRPFVFLSFQPSALLSRRFLWIGSLVFSETQHGVRGSCLVVCGRSGFLKKNLFAQKMGKMGQKQEFLNLLENLVMNFFWIWSIEKFYDVCCILAQILYLGKIWFLRYGQNALDQSDCSIFKLTISLEQNDEKAWFFGYWYRFIEIKSLLKNIGMGMVKNGCGHSVLRTLKLAVCQGKMNEINWFWVCWYKCMKAKSHFNNFFVVVVKNGMAFKVLEL